MVPFLLKTPVRGRAHWPSPWGRPSPPPHFEPLQVFSQPPGPGLEGLVAADLRGWALGVLGGARGREGCGSRRPAPLPGTWPGEVTRALAPPPSPSHCGCDTECRNQCRGEQTPRTRGHICERETPGTTLLWRDAGTGSLLRAPGRQTRHRPPHRSATSVQRAVAGGGVQDHVSSQGHTRRLVVCHLSLDMRKPRSRLCLPAERHLPLGGPQGGGRFLSLAPDVLRKWPPRPQGSLGPGAQTRCCAD